MNPKEIEQEGQLLLQLQLIPHEVGGELIAQRMSDGYVNATAMCKAVGKNFADYNRLVNTQAFVNELSTVMGIPITGLIVTVQGGPAARQGTWVHPDVAINLGQWCSPKFAVAVAVWVREWMTGKITVKAKLPHHIQRYMVNRSEIPSTHWSMLNELTFAIIAPLESEGYTLPDSMVPDISQGKMFCKWLREVKKVEPNSFPVYSHRYLDGRVVPAKLYPNELLADFRKHLHEVWVAKHMEEYFRKRDPKALPFMKNMLTLAANAERARKNLEDKGNRPF